LRKGRTKPNSKESKSPDERDATVRPFWSGTISFGLVSIPVNLFPATRSSRVALRTLGPDGEPLKRDYYDPETGGDLEDSETVRGYRTNEGKVVTVTEEELERLAPEKSRDINLRVFVASSEISPMYFEKAYILTPADKSGKAYRLLAEVMADEEKVAIGQFVLRTKEYLVAVRAKDRLLALTTMLFQPEVRPTKDLGLPGRKRPAKAKIEQAVALVEALAADFDHADYKDRYRRQLRKIVKAKEAGETIKAPPKPEEPGVPPDLMEVLKASLDEVKAGSR